MHLFNNIPQEMRNLNQWVCWKKENRQGKDTKIPYDAKTCRAASTTNPLTWSSFDQAVEMSKRYNGIGFVFSGSDGFFGLDMDGYIDRELINWFDSYAEKSQSGKGCHIIGRGKLPDHKGRRCDNLEIYSKSRYFCMTGDVLHEEPIIDCQEKLNELLSSFFSEAMPTVSVDISKLLNTPPTHMEILEEIRMSAQSQKFEALWRGENLEYASNSEADAAFMAILRWWTYGDEADSISLFRQSGRMREKTERPDYLPRTFAALSGEVRQRIESLPLIVVKAKSEPPWRKITIEHVEQAIDGTILKSLTDVLRCPTDPVLPLEVGLAKAFPLCGCALSGKADKPKTLTDYIGRGSDLSRLKIMTSGGMTPNFWTLLIGESASGKDVGGLLDKIAHTFKYSIGTAGSEEGIADAYIRQPIGLLSISEMLNWLDQRHWQSKAAGFLTPAFSKGHFSFAMSKRSESFQRESDYCFPNICANIQPGVLDTFATKTHVDTGFLGRFLVLRMPSFVAYPVCRSLTPEVKTGIDIIKQLNSLEGDVIVKNEKYNLELNETFLNYEAQPASSWKRLTGEYFPRLALLCSLSNGDLKPEITNDGWDRARVLIGYFFAQAELTFSKLSFDQKQARFECLAERILSIVRQKKCVAKSMISHICGHGSTSRERNEAIQELEDRSKIRVEKSGKQTTLFHRGDVA